MNAINAEGSLPSNLGDLDRLTAMLMADNPNLRGEIPASISGCSLLYYLDLHSCGLTGQIPDGMITFGVPNYVRINLANNELSVDIPPSIGVRYL